MEASEKSEDVNSEIEDFNPEFPVLNIKNETTNEMPDTTLIKEENSDIFIPVSSKIVKTELPDDIENHMCGHCGKNFTKSENLKKHIKTTHEILKEFNCDSCEKSFSQAGHLRRHLKSVHEGIKDY